MNERTNLERLALAAHDRGDDWKTFWPSVAANVAALEPWDRAAYHRLVRHLSHLLTCGDTGGMEPIDSGWERPAEWELDDAATVPVISDTQTAARCLWTPTEAAR